VTARRGVEIAAVGMTTSLGLTAARTAASVRAGIARFAETSIYDDRGAPLVMALVPDDDLPPLVATLAGALSARTERMVRLVGAALREAIVGAPDTEALATGPRPDLIPLLLALPEQLPGQPAPAGAEVLAAIAAQSGLDFNLKRSRVFPSGRAGGFLALSEAIERLSSLADGYVVVGGVDSPLDDGLIDALIDEGRLRAEGVLDGFIPGEGAAFLLLAPEGTCQRRLDREPLARIDGAALGREKGHRYSAEDYLGEGLDEALRGLFAASPSASPIRTVYAGLNGESFHAKEWGIAALRHRARFAEGLRIEHPADCLGDPGAAMAPLLLALAALGIQGGYRQAPCLVWSSSDLEPRGAALLER
jgi:3-oxoacyl-[acyl-carrier-protein] synthase-1